MWARTVVCILFVIECDPQTTGRGTDGRMDVAIATMINKNDVGTPEVTQLP